MRGAWPSGKATGFGPGTRRFESYRPTASIPRIIPKGDGTDALHPFPRILHENSPKEWMQSFLSFVSLPKKRKLDYRAWLVCFNFNSVQHCILEQETTIFNCFNFTIGRKSIRDSNIKKDKFKT